jgi:hypothetical protein
VNENFDLTISHTTQQLRRERCKQDLNARAGSKNNFQTSASKYPHNETLIPVSDLRRRPSVSVAFEMGGEGGGALAGDVHALSEGT